MPDHREAVEQFFTAYAMVTDDALQEPPVEDVDSLVEAFAPHVVGTSPRGVYGSINGKEFRRNLGRGFAHYRAVGGTAMRVTRVKTSELDDYHVLARVDWEFDYQRKQDGRRGTIAFQNMYLLTFADGTPKIFAFITPDEERAMHDHGLV